MVGRDDSGGDGDRHGIHDRGPDGHDLDPELDPVPSIAELRARVRRSFPRIGTGWPVLDGLTGGVAIGRTTVVSAPDGLRQQVLGRMAAWAAGESYRTVLASTVSSTDELLLAVAAGGLGLPARALLATTSHDAWLDARMRVLDLVTLAGPEAPGRFAEVMTSARPAVMAIVDGFSGESESLWDRALRIDPPTPDPWSHSSFDAVLYPLQRRCALVLATPDDGHADFSVPTAARYVRLQPRDAQSRVEITVRTGGVNRSRIVLLRDGLLPQPTPTAEQVRRRGVVNIWEERLPAEITRFADLLGAQAFDLEHVQDDEAAPGPDGVEP